MPSDLVSIVLPTYNGQAHIADSIESCLQQTYSNIELIIVNDCSTDDTLRIVETYAAKDARIRIINNPANLKLPASLNAGFAQAHGGYLTWTSDDNIYQRNAIARMLQALIASSADFVYCGYSVTDMAGNVECVRQPLPPEEIILANIVGACFLYTRQVYDKIKDYNERLFCAEDYDYWSRIYRAGFKLITCPDNLYIYRRHQKSLTNTKSRLICLNTEKVISANLTYANLGARDRSKIYWSYYQRSAVRAGRIFSFRFWLKYLWYRGLSILSPGDYI